MYKQCIEYSFVSLGVKNFLPSHQKLHTVTTLIRGIFTVTNVNLHIAYYTMIFSLTMFGNYKSVYNYCILAVIVDCKSRLYFDIAKILYFSYAISGDIPYHHTKK